MNELTSIETVTLAALGVRAQYGYELVQEIERLTAGRVQMRPGNLYRILDRLTLRGLVREARKETGAGEDERRRYFELTAAGRRAAAAELSMYARMLQQVPALRDAVRNG